ncbi:MAG: TIGR03016 family PEP-CTERM system-associated outer membrane protein [Deltaproteobacteria bacterium]|nr:TIGR03016 family PEP-CTERM system-associated outer membrane protein [Deltaproteobacteria bacterium]TLN03600.1 MAG: TIGR03016 family PEP-CTERM system-associated outer membrane protein [bacterium]
MTFTEKLLSRVLRLSLVIVLVVLMQSGVVTAGEFSFHPSLAVREEYTDNVFEQNDPRRSDFITRLMPGLALKYNAPLWDWDLAYTFDCRIYARNSRNDESTHDLAAKGHIKLIDELLFLDLSDIYKRVSLDVRRDYTQDGLFANQSDSNIATASPYLVFHPGARTTLKTGYRYTNVWYRNPTAIDKREHSGFINASYEYSSKVSFNADYTFIHQNSVTPYNRHSPSAGARYEYADKCFLFAQGGYTWVDYQDAPDFNKPFWSAGITHTLNTLTITLTTGVQYPEDPLSGFTRQTDYNLALTKTFARGAAGLSVYYADYEGETVDRTKKYGVGLTGKYDVTERLSGNLAANLERYEFRDPSGHTRRIYVAPGLSYALPWETTISLFYAYVDYDSASRVEDNYSVNRVALEVRKQF